MGLSASGDGRYLASGSRDGTIRCWSLAGLDRPLAERVLEHAGDVAHHVFVVATLRRHLGKVKVPPFRMMQVRKATAHQGPNKVQGQPSALVTFEQALWVGCARRGREFRSIDKIAAIAGQGRAIAGFQR